MDLADPRDLVAWQRELEIIAAHLAHQAGERFLTAVLGPRPWPAYQHAVATVDAVTAARRAREQVDVVDPGLPVCWTQWWAPARTPARSATGPLR